MTLEESNLESQMFEQIRLDLGAMPQMNICPQIVLLA